MRAFHNNQALKDSTLAQLAKHAKADEIIRGTGWDGHKGCAIGCLLHEYNHALLPERLGWPEWFGHVVDTLHEKVTKGKKWEHGTWVQTVTAAVPIGLTEREFETRVKAPFLIMFLEQELEKFDHAKFPDVKSAVDASIALWKRNDIGSAFFREEAAWAAREAMVREEAWAVRAEGGAGEAWAATRAARAASWAARAQEVEGVARVVETEEVVAWAATRAARAASWAAGEAWEAWVAVRAEEAEAWEAKYDYFADGLLDILNDLQGEAR